MRRRGQPGIPPRCDPGARQCVRGTGPRLRPGTKRVRQLGQQRARASTPKVMKQPISGKNVPARALPWTRVPHSSFPRNEGVRGSNPRVGFNPFAGTSSAVATPKAALGYETGTSSDRVTVSEVVISSRSCSLAATRKGACWRSGRGPRRSSPLSADQLACVLVADNTRLSFALVSDRRPEYCHRFPVAANGGVVKLGAAETQRCSLGTRSCRPARRPRRGPGGRRRGRCHLGVRS